MYKNSFKLILNSTTTITLRHIDTLQALSEEQEQDLVSVFNELGFKTKEHLEVHNILKDWKDRLMESQKNSTPIPPSKSSIGKSLSSLISNMNSTEICLSLCNFDTQRAKSMYMEEDFRVVHEAFNLWSKIKMQSLSDGFETAVVAAGGSLEGGKNRTVHRGADLPKGGSISFG